jgi:hypothetical protein
MKMDQTDGCNLDFPRNALASQLAILQRCPTVMSRLLKRGGSSLLAAKVFVLARLTHKTLSQDPDAPPLIDTLRQRLVSLRVKLLSAINKRISSPEREASSLLEDMCAFALATSSTPTDVLNHFHRVRLEAIGWQLEQSSHIKDHVLKAVKVLLHTLHESQLIFPKRLAEALAKLKERPLMQQKDVRSISELNFSIHERWMADELRNYTPWPRHDELQKPEADKIIRSWAKQALSTFMETMKLVLSAEHDFGEIMALRKELLEAWPWSDNRLPGLHSVDVVDQLRDLLNGQLSNVIKECVEELQAIPDAISDALQVSKTLSARDIPLWESPVTSMDYSNGATKFKDTVRERYRGSSDETAAIVVLYNRWIVGITSIKSILKEMRDTRWDDDIGDDLDDLDSRQTLLSEDDPRVLEETLTTALADASKKLHTALQEITKSAVEPSAGSPQQIIFILRVIREISQLFISRDRSIAGPALDSTSSSDIIDPLHSALGSFATSASLVAYQRYLGKLTKASVVPTRALWEGSPPLPVQPSSSAFKFLRELTKGMASRGADLWSSGAVDAVKGSARNQLASHILNFASQNQPIVGEKPATNGHSEKEDGDELEADEEIKIEDNKELTNGHASIPESPKNSATKENLTQLLLDALYFQVALSRSEKETANTASFQHAIDTIVSSLEIDSASVSRIRKSAADYWKRTYLIFALLVPEG